MEFLSVVHSHDKVQFWVPILEEGSSVALNKVAVEGVARGREHVLDEIFGDECHLSI